MVYLKTEALDLAIQEFQSVISLSQDPILTSIALGNIGGIYARQEYLEGAVIKFKESISFNSLNKDARISLAETYCHLEELGQAIEEWKTIISIWPDDYIAYYRLAQLYIDDHNAEMAIMYLRKSLQIRPDYIDARILLDQIYQASALNRSIEGKEGTLVKY